MPNPALKLLPPRHLDDLWRKEYDRSSKMLMAEVIEEQRREIERLQLFVAVKGLAKEAQRWKPTKKLLAEMRLYEGETE